MASSTTFRSRDRRKGARGGSGGLPTDKLKTPDEKQFEQRITSINEQLKSKELELKRITKTLEQDASAELVQVNNQISELEAERLSISKEEKRLTEELKELGQMRIQKRNEASKLVAGLRHRRHEPFDESIRRLQRKLATNQLTPQEENRLHAEIEMLVKSKEQLDEYIKARKESDEMGDQQETIRNARHDLYKEMSEAMSKITELRDKQSKLKAEMSRQKEREKERKEQKDRLLKEMQGLRQQHQKEMDNFKHKQAEFLMAARESREVAQRALEEGVEERRRKRETATRDSRIRKMVSQKELQRCEDDKAIKSLILYIDKLLTSSSGCHQGSASLSADHEATASPNPPPHKNSLEEKPGEFLKRKTEDVLLESSSGLGRRKSRRDKKKGSPSSKKLNFNVETLSQFQSLNLNTPSTYADLPDTLILLQEKLANYEHGTESEAGDSGVGVESGLDEQDACSQEDPTGLPTLIDPLNDSENLKRPSLDEGAQNGTSVV